MFGVDWDTVTSSSVVTSSLSALSMFEHTEGNQIADSETWCSVLVLFDGPVADVFCCDRVCSYAGFFVFLAGPRLICFRVFNASVGFPWFFTGTFWDFPGVRSGKMFTYREIIYQWF